MGLLGIGLLKGPTGGGGSYERGAPVQPNSPEEWGVQRPRRRTCATTETFIYDGHAFGYAARVSRTYPLCL